MRSPAIPRFQVSGWVEIGPNTQKLHQLVPRLDPTSRPSIHAAKASEGFVTQRPVTKSRSIQNVSGGIPNSVANARRKIAAASGKSPSSKGRIDTRDGAGAVKIGICICTAPHFVCGKD